MENFEIIKYGLIFIGIALIILILFISYKTDNNQQNESSSNEENNIDDDYENIQTDEEQSLYSSFDEEELAKEEADMNVYNIDDQKSIQNSSDVLDNNFEISNNEVNEIPGDFEFDDILSDNSEHLDDE